MIDCFLIYDDVVIHIQFPKGRTSSSKYFSQEIQFPISVFTPRYSKLQLSQQNIQLKSVPKTIQNIIDI